MCTGLFAYTCSGRPRPGQGSDATSMATVTLDRLRKVYPNGHVGVDEATFEIAAGELLVLVGPSGCGKTTLLRMIAGLESISSGTLSIGGRVVNEVSPKDRDIAMVFQNYALYPHMTVAENLAFGLRLRGKSKAEIGTRVRNAAQLLELEQRLDSLPAALSGGQRQRVALGRALVREPKVFLLDEPLSNLDAKLRLSMRVEIARLHRQLGTTMIYVTHDQVEAMTLAQRVIVMNKGVAEQIGTPSEVYQRPASLFVAGFIGSPAMNLLPGTLSADGSQLLLADGMALPLPVAKPQWAGRQLTLGVRPEHIQLVAQGQGVPLQLQTLELLGADNLAHGQWGGHGVIARLSHETLPTAGSTLYLQLPAQALHFFDTHSGLRMD